MNWLWAILSILAAVAVGAFVRYIFSDFAPADPDTFDLPTRHEPERP
ncbi:hypothetical protein ACIRLA_46595 [Streptomyces sp. NPDC102364]